MQFKENGTQNILIFKNKDIYLDQMVTTNQPDIINIQFSIRQVDIIKNLII